MKKCIKCDEFKNIDCFGKDKYKSDGLNPYCKRCIKLRNASKKDERREYNKRSRSENRDEYNEYVRKYYADNRQTISDNAKKSYYKNRESIALRRKDRRDSPEAREKEAERQKEWRSENGDKYRAYIRKWQVNNRERVNAHAKVHRAVKNGTLIRSEACEKCGTDKGKMEGHHDDYSKPLDVKWLCRLCHGGKISKL